MGTHYSHLGLEARIEIYRMHELGASLQQVAERIGCHRSTVSRELRRNSLATKSWPGGYEPVRAEKLYRRRRQWDCRFKLARQPELAKLVHDRLAMGWSPEQIAGRLTLEAGSVQVSHESIYRYIYHLSGQKIYWHRLLPRAKSRRGRLGRRGGSPVELIRDRKSIALRPAAVAARETPGHWESDGMAFQHNRQIVLVSHERVSRAIKAVRQRNKTAATTRRNLMAQFRSLPAALRRSVTLDNGSEFFEHWRLTQALAIDTYFCDPHSPWQKGGVENAIGRLRRWLPSKTDPAKLSAHRFNALIRRYNSTPRKCLGFKTPSEVFMQTLQSLHFNRDSTFRLAPE
jgi:IS30 family transposase